MSFSKFITLDGNEAAAQVAYRINEVCAIYPITPASSMGEWADEWAAHGIKNIWGTVPTITEMQSEGGAAGAVHGALQAGAVTTTFTASQGLLLMIPNMYKIAGELTPTVFNIAARSLATHALSIFCDHSDVMSARGTGWALLSAASVQEAMDFALISQAATLKSRVPFLFFFDGFRTSHEVAKIEPVSEAVMREMIKEEWIAAHKARALSPDHPVIRGTAQNPDVFFQNREALNPYYRVCPGIVQEQMDRFAQLTGRQYRLYEYEGHPEAEQVIVIMGSGAETAAETAAYLNAQGEKTGVLKVRLYRPFDVQGFAAALPPTTRSLGVLDRTKEPGAGGEPLFLDVVSALIEARDNGWDGPRELPRMVGGRYGLSSKEFTPAMVKAVFDNLKQAQPRNHFTVGIHDDVSHSSLPYDPEFDIESQNVFRALFYGLGADGTVGANKNSIKIIGENTANYAQGFFVYDSKKSGALTVSHLRFGPEKIRSPYLIDKAHFVACHQTNFLEKFRMLDKLLPGGVFLLNAPWPQQEVWDRLPRSFQEQVISKKIRVYTIDAQQVAEESGMGRRINTVMQVCFFAISGVLPQAEAIEAIKESIRKSYAKKGEPIVQMNLKAVDNTLAHLYELEIPAHASASFDLNHAISPSAPEFVRQVLGQIIAGEGDALPVSAFPVDGTFPLATSQYEKRNIALQIPVWDPEICIQCNKCTMVCPHATIRAKVAAPAQFAGAPETYKFTEARDRDWKEQGLQYTIQIAPEDCTGCGVCVEVCPVKNKSNTSLKALNMGVQVELRAQERENWNFFLDLPEMDRSQLKLTTLRHQQLQQPLFEFSGACAGCGETPYLKLLSQLFGDRTLIANATGCSSIYGGNLPTTPWAKNHEGRGPAWSNSLFEDNAEFGLGMRLAVEENAKIARDLLQRLALQIGEDLVQEILSADQSDEPGIFEQRIRVSALKAKLGSMEGPEAARLLSVADYLVKKSVWIVGGDGWAYDIGYGGLDHIMASGKNVNILVLDTEVYSNTGGQTSKATPLSAVAKFSAGGKPTRKKDLGMIAMSYGSVYVAVVAFGARDEQTLKAFIEAEAYDGPSIIIAYSHCIAHGIDMEAPLKHQKALIDSGQWVLYRFNPDLAREGKNPLSLDSKAKGMTVAEYMNMENRFRMLAKSRPEVARAFFIQAQEDADARYQYLQFLASREPVGV